MATNCPECGKKTNKLKKGSVGSKLMCGQCLRTFRPQARKERLQFAAKKVREAHGNGLEA